MADGLSSLGSAAPPPPKPPPAPAVPASPPPVKSGVPAKPQINKTESEKDTEPEEPEDLEVEEEISLGKAAFETENLSPHGARLVAALVDNLILYSVLGVLIGIAGAFSQFDGTLIGAGVVAYFLLGWLYYGFGESSKAGGFIGKRMSKIKVVRLSDGQIPTFGISSLRAILKILISLSVILPFIVFLTPRRQGIHDLICATVVRGREDEN